MQTPKILLACGTALCCLSLLPAHAADTPEEARMRQALRERLAELNPPSATPPPAAPTRPAPAAPVQPLVTDMAPPVTTPPPTVGEAHDARLQEAMRSRISEPAPQPNTSTVESTVRVVASPEAAKPAPAPAAGMEAPALPIPTTKEARLSSLLQRYKADQITPEEYHRQRAQILAE